MHSLALALHKKGYEVTGSDDEINEPSRSRLKAAGLLPEQTGWFPEKISTELSAVILGMHARADNPELLKAQQLGLPVYSYPEYLFEQSKYKKRIVIGGSHGKTTITAMSLHILKQSGINFDYMAGSAVPGFDNMVKLSDAPLIILEGDEYLSSPIDRRPKFHWYRPHIAVLSGIAWDHINVFPTFENYTEQFRIFIEKMEEGGTLFYCEEDEVLRSVAESADAGIKKIPYRTPEHITENGITYLIKESDKYPLLVFGKHNLQNAEAARWICRECGITDEQFYKALSSFKGAARRLEKIFDNGSLTVFRDFAHSPSKLKATVNAVAQQFPHRKVIACMELHTFSSLSENFLNEYAHCMDEAGQAVVFYNPETITHKKLPPVSMDAVKSAFKRDDLLVFDSPAELSAWLHQCDFNNSVLLLMSSGTFSGLDVNSLLKKAETSV
ncbi:MAG: peptidoglycan synthetase [Bacteroidia bacterium]|nr:peptidoglycan synthetase [Bacteroidia bacterium]